MRAHGTLTKWNDDRGFGFVALPQDSGEIFVHISAFPRNGVRPRVGEMISFDVRSGPDGKKRAENVARRGDRNATRKVRDLSSSPNRSLIFLPLAIVALSAFGAFGYNTYTSDNGMIDKPAVSLPARSTQQTETADRFRCDWRTHCSQMTSCAEANYFLQHCPNTQMDGNHNGEPCEQQWCN